MIFEAAGIDGGDDLDVVHQAGPLSRQFDRPDLTNGYIWEVDVQD